MILKLCRHTKIFNSEKEIFDFSNYSTKSKYYDNLNTFSIGNMKDETASVANKKFVGLKLKIHSFLVNNNEYKKSRRQK